MWERKSAPVHHVGHPRRLTRRIRRSVWASAPVRTQNIDAGGLGGCPAAYAAVRLDVVVVQYGHAEYPRPLLVYAAGVPEAAGEPPR